MQWRAGLRQRGEVTCPSQDSRGRSPTAAQTLLREDREPTPAPSLLPAPHPLDLSAMRPPASLPH